MNVGILLLAAGSARRFRSDKRFALMPGGNTVLEGVLDNITLSGLPVIVCLGPSDHELAANLEARGIACQLCQRATEGMGGTLAEGIAKLSNLDGVLIALADMPWIDPASYRAIAEKMTQDTICVPVHGGRRGHPVGFGRRYFREMRQSGGDTGARHLLDLHTDRVREIPVDDPAIHRDIDVPADIHCDGRKVGESS